jgi:sugar lactone lactonase YvrE
MNTLFKPLRLAAAIAVLCLPLASQAGEHPRLLASGLLGAQGSTIGPDGALYVTEGGAGRVVRIDPWTGHQRTFASGLPPSLIGVGGAVDVEFIGHKAYVLVALNGTDVGGTTPVGIYRVDGRHSFTLLADLGAFSQANPPATPFDLSQGVQYALEKYRGGLIVTDGHHNRVLYVTRKGDVSVFRAFDNVVPTGLAVEGSTVYLALAGPTPHNPEDGRVLAFGPGWRSAGEVASGAPLLVDVEFGGGRSLYALSQGTWDGAFPGSPALPGTGALMKLDGDGQFVEVVSGLNIPTSLEIRCNDAYVVTLTGEVWKYRDAIEPSFPDHSCRHDRRDHGRGHGHGHDRKGRGGHD